MIRENSQEALLNIPVIPMNHIPDGRVGNWEVNSFSVSHADAVKFSALSAVAMRSILPGDYKRLIVHGEDGIGETMMSNTPAEIYDFVFWADVVTGHVLINGLGLGVLVTYLLTKEDILSITVIENSPDVIALVAPHFNDNRLKIIEADAFTWYPQRGERNYWDFVWHDIWLAISAENIPQMRRLMRRYVARCEAQESWCMDICAEQRRKEVEFFLLLRQVRNVEKLLVTSTLKLV